MIFTSYSDSTRAHRSIEEQACSIDRHDYDEDAVLDSFFYRLYKNKMYKHEPNRPIVNVHFSRAHSNGKV